MKVLFPPPFVCFNEILTIAKFLVRQDKGPRGIMKSSSKDCKLFVNSSEDCKQSLHGGKQVTTRPSRDNCHPGCLNFHSWEVIIKNNIVNPHKGLNLFLEMVREKCWLESINSGNTTLTADIFFSRAFRELWESGNRIAR